jgi:hypothetical protein
MRPVGGSLPTVGGRGRVCAFKRKVGVMKKARLELVLALAFGALAVAAGLWPTWVEQVTGLEPDGGSGQAEWWLVAVFAMLALSAAVLSRRSFRAVRATQAATGSLPG